MSDESPPPPRRRGLLLLVLGATALAGAGVAALLVNIAERKAEGRAARFQVEPIGPREDDPAVWGRNFPIQYDDYRRTVDQVRTRYGGSEAVPRTPTAADPRSVVAQSRLEEDPRLKAMWAGYAFAKDFREERGHAFMLEDQMFTERQQVAKQPGTCLHCHGSMVVPYLEAGDGDLVKGFEKLNSLPYAEAAKGVHRAVGCIDCHDPATMKLRITRPGFFEGIRAWKASEGVKDYDPNTMATHAEMRSYVCGQCHVEYYFKGPGKRLTYPWSKGLRADEILAHYEESGFQDWTHAESGAPVLKAQHPEFETWSQGIHARSGVSCADCHMPYRKVGASKVSDHHVRSPLLNINRACQTCHRAPEAELLARVETIQERTHSVRGVALDALLDLIAGIKAARAAGADDAALAEPRRRQRRGQFLLDFVEAENSTGFHAPQESVRVLALSLDEFRRGQMALPPRAAGK
jgi:nitrite reductase (cytochrome c-552)